MERVALVVPVVLAAQEVPVEQVAAAEVFLVVPVADFPSNRWTN